ncbi:ABC transporter substrate-binding protein [Haloarchaeobius sp. HME9146]|uniref:ABC transporter substrate-binding protein n=1 Tax=Haloarchaeobius sp. HME9146 TaxID=2978732 RepID=UPI0021C04AA1|nr:ABC transporter substrate-binding protein [Haloarchaeobius sp. HME9146]MCT9097570.1 ABC transporter substrate-binding protein [Haloarchaeobius sp. HME9146]
MTNSPDPPQTAESTRDPNRPRDDGPSLDRRTLLGGLASAGMAATAGCAKKAHSMLNRSNPEQVSLSIKTVPADDDPVATRIARSLATRLKQVGIDATVELLRRENLLIDVLFKQSFDLYVWQLPPLTDPDALRSLVHSRFVVEPGWQNPFGYANLGVDDLLERQRRLPGSRRQDVLSTLQERLAQTLPFVTIAFPSQVRAVRNETVSFQGGPEIHSPVGYCTLDAVGGTGTTGNETATTTAAEPRTLTATLSDPRQTENLNPLATEYRDGWTIPGLLYDPLARAVDGEIRPWLARNLDWGQDDGRDGPVATVTLREDATWHDGTPITADDVAFTYRFLSDTSLGRMESPLPAPAFRGQSTLVESAMPLDDQRIRLSFVPCTRDVAWRALTVPVLPRHDWEQASKQANVPGVQNGPVTRALVRDNIAPVGSGPLRYESRAVRNSLTLVRNDDHFLHRGDTEGLPSWVDGFDFDELTFRVVPSAAVARDLVLAGDADVSASPLRPGAVQEVGASSDVTLHVRDSSAPYHLGFNVRAAPLSNTRFRQALATLLDREHLVDEVFDGFARPAVSPLAATDSVPATLQWAGSDPLFPFPGEDGELDADRARQAFIDAGYRYTNDGRLLAR